MSVRKEREKGGKSAIISERSILCVQITYRDQIICNFQRKARRHFILISFQLLFFFTSFFYGSVCHFCSRFAFELKLSNCLAENLIACKVSVHPIIKWLVSCANHWIEAGEHEHESELQHACLFVYTFVFIWKLIKFPDKWWCRVNGASVQNIHSHWLVNKTTPHEYQN